MHAVGLGNSVIFDIWSYWCVFTTACRLRAVVCMFVYSYVFFGIKLLQCVKILFIVFGSVVLGFLTMWNGCHAQNIPLHSTVLSVFFCLHALWWVMSSNVFFILVSFSSPSHIISTVFRFNFLMLLKLYVFNTVLELC